MKSELKTYLNSLKYMIFLYEKEPNRQELKNSFINYAINLKTLKKELVYNLNNSDWFEILN